MSTLKRHVRLSRYRKFNCSINKKNCVYEKRTRVKIKHYFFGRECWARVSERAELVKEKRSNSKHIAMDIQEKKREGELKRKKESDVHLMSFLIHQLAIFLMCKRQSSTQRFIGWILLDGYKIIKNFWIFPDSAHNKKF